MNKSEYNHVRLQADGWLVCLSCGDRYQISMPCPIYMMSVQLEGWNKEHKGCLSTKASDERNRLAWEDQFTTPEKWMAGTDRGISSEAIWYAMRGGFTQHHDTPRDPSDFGRCLRLVEAFGWRDQLPKLVDVYLGAGWANVVAHWDMIASLFKEEVPHYREWNHRGEAPRTFALMKELGL